MLFGALTVTGSFMAFGKLQELIPGRPDHVQAGQNAVNLTAMVVAFGVADRADHQPDERGGVLHDSHARVRARHFDGAG